MKGKIGIIFSFNLEKTSVNNNSCEFYINAKYLLRIVFLQSASLGGAAHLVNFCGTDTVAGMVLARLVYLPFSAPYLLVLVFR